MAAPIADAFDDQPPKHWRLARCAGSSAAFCSSIPILHRQTRFTFGIANRLAVRCVRIPVTLAC